MRPHAEPNPNATAEPSRGINGTHLYCHARSRKRHAHKTTAMLATNKNALATLIYNQNRNFIQPLLPPNEANMLEPNFLSQPPPMLIGLYLGILYYQPYRPQRNYYTIATATRPQILVLCTWDYYTINHIVSRATQ